MDTARYHINLPEYFFAFSTYLLAFSMAISIVAVQIAAALVLIGGIILWSGRRGNERIPRVFGISVAIFLLLTVVSSLAASEISRSIPQLKKSWVMLCLFPLIAFSRNYSKDRLIELFILGTTIASALALFRYFSGAVERAAPFSGGYTTIAIFEAAALPLTFWQYSQYRKLSMKLPYLIFGIIMALGLIFSKTRAGWAAAFVAVSIVAFSLNKKRALIGLVLCIILLAAIPSVRGIVLERFKTDKKGGVTSGRLLLYKAAADPLLHLPIFGYGPGSFESLVSPHILEKIGDRNIKSWHSTPLEILIESGPLAAIAFLALAVIPYKRAWTNRKRIAGQRRFSITLLASLTAVYLAGLTTNLLRDFMLFSLLVFLWSTALLSEDSYAEKPEAVI